MLNKIKENEQRAWFVPMLQKYFQTTYYTVVGVRRFHYWLVSLPESERMIPGKSTPGKGRGKKGDIRLYRNHQFDYIVCSESLMEARMMDEIPWECIQDDKNEDIFIPFEKPMPGKITIYSNIPDLDIPNTDEMKLLPDFENTIDSNIFYHSVTDPKFNHQKYHLLVVIEKATAKDRLIKIKDKHGADLLIFSGQPSGTRLHQAVDNAMKKDKPIALFYISDLDVAGWNMPDASFRNINDMYPKDNILIRVGLTRDQVKEYNLPDSFNMEDKEGQRNLKEKFVKETGSDKCVELDSLSEDQIFKLLDNALSKYSGLAEDKREYDELNNIKISTDYIEYIRNDYENLKIKYNSLTEKINKFYKDCGIREFFENLRPEIEEYNRIKGMIVGN